MSRGDSRPRWSRLAEELAALDPRVDERPYAESVRGRVEHGVTRSITFRHPAGGVVHIADRWWRKNPDVWVGWEVAREDREGMQLRVFPLTKKRGDVARFVGEALS